MRPYPEQLRASQPGGWPDAAAMRAQCQGAVAALDRAKAAPPLQLTQEASVAERAVARLRQQGGAPQAPRWQAALAGLNAALSLIVGIEYPTSGIRREVIQQARDALDKIQF